MDINGIHRIMENLAHQRIFFRSKADFQKVFSLQFKTTAPAYQVCLDFQPNISVPKIVDIWGKAQSGNIAVELRYPTAQQQFLFKGTQELVSLADDPIETADSEIREAVDAITWLSAARMIRKGFPIVLTNQRELWEGEEFRGFDWRDYSSLNQGKNPLFRYFVLEVEDCVFPE